MWLTGQTCNGERSRAHAQQDSLELGSILKLSEQNLVQGTGHAPRILLFAARLTAALQEPGEEASLIPASPAASLLQGAVP